MPSVLQRSVILVTIVVLGGATLVLVFLPDAVLAAAHVPASPTALLLAQLYGASLGGLVAATWVARGTLLGGIFGRSLVVGSFTHALIGTLALLRVAVAPGAPPLIWAALVVYISLAVGFGALLFGKGPVIRGS